MSYSHKCPEGWECRFEWVYAVYLQRFGTDWTLLQSFLDERRALQYMAERKKTGIVLESRVEGQERCYPIEKK